MNNKIKVKLDDGSERWVTDITKDDIKCHIYSNKAVRATEENLAKCQEIYPDLKFFGAEV